MDSQLNEARTELSQLKGKLGDLTMENTSQKEQLIAIEKKDDHEFKVASGRLENRLKEMTTQHQIEMSNMKDNVKKDYAIRFEETKSQMKLMVARLEKEMQSVKLELDASKLVVITLEEQIENLKRDKGSLRAEIIELHNKIYRLEHKNSRTNNQESRAFSTQVLSLESSAIQSVSNSCLSNSTNNGLSICSSLSTNSLNLMSDRRLSNCSKTSTTSKGSNSGRLKVVPTGSGSLFTCEDEEFNFSERNKRAMQNGSYKNCCSTIPDDLKCAMCKLQRKAELSRRNTMVAPHLRDCYSSEFNDSGIKVGCDQSLYRC